MMEQLSKQHTHHIYMLSINQSIKTQTCTVPHNQKFTQRLFVMRPCMGGTQAWEPQQGHTLPHASMGPPRQGCTLSHTSTGPPWHGSTSPMPWVGSV